MPVKPSTTDVTSRLKTIPLFSACTQRELNAVSMIMKEVKFDAGDVICQEGETGVGLHVVVDGQTSVRVGGRTRRRLGAGAFFGEIALLDGGPRSATVVAETPVTTLSLPAWTFRSILKSQPALAIKMLEEVCRRLRTSDSSLSA